MKKLIALMLVAVMAIGTLAGCSISFGGNSDNNTASSAEEAVSSAPAEAASSQEEIASSQEAASSEAAAVSSSHPAEQEEALDDSYIRLTMSLFGKRYTLGKSRVYSLTDDDWGMDPEDWKDIDLEEKIEYKATGGSYLTMDKNTTEVEISYKNLAETFAVPADCILTHIEFSGSPDGAIAKAGVKILNDKVDLEACNTISKLETALSSAAPNYTKEVSEYSSFNSYTYKADLTDGRLYMYVNEDTASSTVTKYNVSLDLSYEYTYQE